MGRATSSSEQARQRTRRGVQAAIAAYLLWGFLTIYWKELHRFDPFELIGWRIISASVVLAAVVTTRRRWGVLLGVLREPRLLGRLAVAAVLLTANWTGYVWAVANDRVLETALGYFMAPLATMVLGVTVLGERASRLQRVALGLAAAAVVVLTISYGRPPWIAFADRRVVEPLRAAQAPGAAAPIDSLAGETFLLLVPAVALVAVLAGRTGSVPSPRRPATGRWSPSPAWSRPSRCCCSPSPPSASRSPCSGALQYLVPTINLVLGWLVYDEPMPAVRLAGFGLVWIALARRHRRPGRHAAPTQRTPGRCALSPTAGQ